MIHSLRNGAAGFIVAAIVAAALSPSINSMAATTINDFYVKYVRPDADDATLMRLSKIATVFWGVVQIGVAMGAQRMQQSVLDAGLSVLSLASGLGARGLPPRHADTARRRPRHVYRHARRPRHDERGVAHADRVDLARADRRGRDQRGRARRRRSSVRSSDTASAMIDRRDDPVSDPAPASWVGARRARARHRGDLSRATEVGYAAVHAGAKPSAPSPSTRRRRPAPPGTIFDLASLTKVIATTALAMRLMDVGRLTSTSRGHWLPAWRGQAREHGRCATCSRTLRPARAPASLRRPRGSRGVPARDLRHAARVRAAHAVALQRPGVHPARLDPRGRRRRCRSPGSSMRSPLLAAS